MSSFVEGLLAGYGIAIPVGAVSVMIMTTGMTSGFRTGFMAGAGAATADLLYATLASLAGAALVLVLQPLARELRIAGGLVLICFAAIGVIGGLRGAAEAAQAPPRARPLRTYARLLGITIINPLTVVYFAALILGRDAGRTPTASGRLLFVAGAALSSLSWQTLLAGLGALLRRGLPPRLRLGAVLLGNLIVAALGVRILVRALA
jgi:threonine/homoserine/homoserine lactone efflux protein